MCTPKCMFVCVLIFSRKIHNNEFLFVRSLSSTTYNIELQSLKQLLISFEVYGFWKACITCILGCITKISKGVKSDCRLTVFYCIRKKSVLPQKFLTSTTSRLPWLNISFVNIMVKYSFIFSFHMLWHIYSKWLFQASDPHLVLSFFYYFPEPLPLHIKCKHPHSWFDILVMNFFQIICFIFTLVIMAYIILIRKVWLLRNVRIRTFRFYLIIPYLLLDPAETDWLQACKTIIGLFPSILHSAFPHVDWKTLLQNSHESNFYIFLLLCIFLSFFFCLVFLGFHFLYFWQDFFSSHWSTYLSNTLSFGLLSSNFP